MANAPTVIIDDRDESHEHKENAMPDNDEAMDQAEPEHQDQDMMPPDDLINEERHALVRMSTSEYHDSGSATLVQRHREPIIQSDTLVFHLTANHRIRSQYQARIQANE